MGLKHGKRPHTAIGGPFVGPARIGGDAIIVVRGIERVDVVAWVALVHRVIHGKRMGREEYEKSGQDLDLRSGDEFIPHAGVVRGGLIGGTIGDVAAGT